MSTLKVGDKVYPSPTTCSRYSKVVGTIESIDGIWAKVSYPAIENYANMAYYYSWEVEGTKYSSSYNPFEIYKEPFTASLWLNGLVLVDQSIPPGTVI